MTPSVALAGEDLVAAVHQLAAVGEAGERVVGGVVGVLGGEPTQLGVRLRVADRGAQRGREGLELVAARPRRA